MSENSQEHSRGTGDASGEYFTVATPLHPVRPGYIRRSADEALYQVLVSGQYAHVIAPNRTGKSSLIAATSARLQNNGYKVAVLDLGQISERDGGTDPGRWYYSIAYRLLRQLRLKIDLQEWWQDKSILSNRQRLVEFYVEVVLQHIPERIVIFVDEIQRVANRSLAEHLLASIRAAHNARITEPEFQRLCFVIAGECDPLTALPDPATSPFAVSQEIRLDDFTRDDLDTFSTELNLLPSDAALALDRIYYWTSGHPYLSQKLARSVARERISGNIKEHVDRIALLRLAGRAALHSEPHMSHIHRQIVNDKKNSEALLNIYGRLRKGIDVAYDPEVRHHRMLLATGLVVVDESGRLKVRNRLYKVVFTARWANENLPLHWRGPLAALLILLLVTAVPFAYTQLLPNPYMRVLSSPELDLESVYGAYINLRSFPGHGDAAERLFRNQLELRAGSVRDVTAMEEIENYARRLPESAAFADQLVAEFWDRRVARALQGERRDEALVASLESMVVSTPMRRRRTATLIGDDYTLLRGTIPAQFAAQLLFEPRNLVATWANGASVSQWSLGTRPPAERGSWSISALDVTPLVRRVVVDRGGDVRRIGLRVNIAHPRLPDLRLKLIAPGGRTVELDVEQPSATPDEAVTFGPEELAAMSGEPLDGTWSLSVRDEETGVNGYLAGWELNLNSQVVVEEFERGIDIPDPVARESDVVWFSPNGRFAIARAMQSDSARLWDLTDAEPVRAIAVPASEQVLSLSNDARLLTTTGQRSVHVWQTADGRRQSELEVGVTGGNVLPSADGQHVLAIRRDERNTRFELWSLQSAEVIAQLDVAGSPALVAVDAAAGHLAVADYDRGVRIWDLRGGDLLAQIGLDAQPSEISLSANGDTLGVVYGESGFAVWRTDRPDDPLVSERGSGSWQFAFSPSGSRFLAGNPRQGFQVYRSADGALSGPPLGAGTASGDSGLLAFSDDENIVVTGDGRGITRVWQAPVSPSIFDRGADDPPTGHQLWRESGDSVSALGPGGERLAISDNAGHVHILHVDASAEEIAEAGDELSFLGHRGAVVDLVFNQDGSLVASADMHGSVRIWDTDTGLPRPYHVGGSSSAIDQMEFSPSGSRLGVLGGQRIRVMNVETGALLADVELGELHPGIAFADDDALYLGGESGTLRILSADRTGSWNLRNIWAGSAPLRRLEAFWPNQLLVTVDSVHRAQLLNLENGRIGAAVLQLPDAVEEIAFSPNGSRVLFRTARWVHRAGVSPAGLTWLDAVRTPKLMNGSDMVFEAPRSTHDTQQPEPAADPLGNRVMVLTRDAGFAEVALIDFTYQTGATVFGSREQLLADWRSRLGIPEE
jgi:WD40 repeat protein